MLLSLALDSQFSQEVFVPESDRPSGESTPPYNQDCHGCHGNFVWLLSFFILSSFFASAIPDLPGARPSENLPGRCPAIFRSRVFVFAECLEFSVCLCPLVGSVSWQEILHGLIVTKPADPHLYVEAPGGYHGS